MVAVWIYASAGHTAPATRRAAVVASAPGRIAPTSPATTGASIHISPPAPALRVSVPTSAGSEWTVTALVHGRPAAWLAERSGVTLMRFDQSLVHLTLHAGYNDGGASGWTYGDQITPREIHSLVAGFNGGFKLSYSDVGFSPATMSRWRSRAVWPRSSPTRTGPATSAPGATVCRAHTRRSTRCYRTSTCWSTAAWRQPTSRAASSPAGAGRWARAPRSPAPGSVSRKAGSWSGPRASGSRRPGLPTR